MNKLNVKIVMEAIHNYTRSRALREDDKGKKAPLYRHIVLYHIRIEDQYGKYTSTDLVTPFRTKNKNEAKKIQDIVRKKSTALLYIKSEVPHLKRLAELKLSMFPDTPIRIKHTYKNKIPKRHLLHKSEWKDKGTNSPIDWLGW